MELISQQNQKLIEDRTRFEQIEKEMLSYPQVDIPVRHYFGPGVYVREITMPAGSLVLGAEHKGEQLNNLISGELDILDENNQVVRLTGPFTYLAKPGRKMAYVVKTAVWQTIIATDETDIEKIEDSIVIKSNTWKELKGEKKWPS